MSKRANFLNSRRTVELPSNLLTLKKQQNDAKCETLPIRHKIFDTSNRYFRTLQTPTFVGEKSIGKDKEVLYKRLTNIRGQNKQIGNLSFSKMLSRMVVLDQQNAQQPFATPNPFEPRMRQTIHVTPIAQKLYNMNCSSPTTRAPSRSINIDQQVKKPSRRLFKKYYLPSSQVTQTLYLETGNPADKYIYKDGKKVECKRIHNFYTSHMFRNGYDKCFRKTISHFKAGKEDYDKETI